MLAAARDNLREAEVTNVELLKGMIESIPLPALTADVVISNCVIGLSTDKPAVFDEIFRVLRPRGRMGIADVVAGDDLLADPVEGGREAQCITQALSVGGYHDLLDAAGFHEVSVTITRDIAEGVHSAIVQATKPAATDTTASREMRN